ncbi:MAG: hypothetical protein KJZ87_27700, partial [Thermoguttaceae bacterium]|nr:hypothetical protein [Thermoguttaceae bacterium]
MRRRLGIRQADRAAPQLNRSRPQPLAPQIVRAVAEHLGREHNFQPKRHQGDSAMQSSRATSAATDGSPDKRFLPLCTARLKALSGRPVCLLSAILALAVSAAAAEPTSAPGGQPSPDGGQVKPVLELRFDGDL